jgi:hypothetical protein
MPVLTVKKPVKSPYPSLRTALWLYFVVLIATAAIKIQLSANVDSGLVRLLIALFVVAIFTGVALFLTRTDLLTVLGNPPDIISLIASIVAGFATWAVAVWITFLIYRGLDTSVGTLSPAVQSNLSVFGLIIQTAIFIPICQGLLFWAFITHAATGLKRIQAALLVALLFAMYGLITSPSDLGIANIPGQFIVSLIAALAVAYTDCVWYGVAIVGSFSLAWAMLDNNLLNLQVGLLTYLGSDFGTNFLSVRWLFLVIVGAFLAFFALQVIRLRALAEPDNNPPAPTKSLWTVPLVLSILFILLAGYGEIALRKQRPPTVAVTPQVQAAGSGGSTIPPVPPTPIPTP